MKSLFRFIFSRRFVIHLLLASACAVIALFLIFAWMSSYTLHGEYQEVPDVIGMDLRKAEALIDERGFRIEVEDSVYVEGAIPGSVIHQNPEVEYIDPKDSTERRTMVKQDRKIYVNIASYLPPQVEIPDLVGKSKRSALNLLEIIGIGVAEMRYEPDQVCTDCVLKQLYQEKSIEPGTRLYKGDEIVLVLGRRDAQYVSIPKIVGYTYEDAQNILNRVSLNMGEVYGGCDDCSNHLDSMNAYVLKQSPEWGTSANLGAAVGVYLTQDASLIDQD